MPARGWRGHGTLLSVYEQPSPTRRFGPTFIVVLVVLAVVTATMAYFVVRRVVAGQSSAAAGSGGSGSTPGAGATPEATGQTSAPGTRQSCPEITVDAVRAAGLPGELTLIFYVEGERPKGAVAGAEVWICQDSDGTLIYQGHRKTGPFLAATSDDTLLLGRGILGKVERDGEGFVGINPRNRSNPDDPNRTEYHVSAEGITQVHRPSGNTTFYRAITTTPPA